MEHLTITDAGLLAEILSGFNTDKRLWWYQEGSDSAERPQIYMQRAFTHDGGGFWFDKDDDIRDAYIWLTGVENTYGERWIKVSDIMRAIDNLDGKHGFTEPIAQIKTKA